MHGKPIELISELKRRKPFRYDFNRVEFYFDLNFFDSKFIKLNDIITREKPFNKDEISLTNRIPKINLKKFKKFNEIVMKYEQQNDSLNVKLNNRTFKRKLSRAFLPSTL